MVGVQIEYSPGGELAGATPAFVPAVLTFVEVMRQWQELGITVGSVHEHVVSPSPRSADMRPAQFWTTLVWGADSEQERPRPSIAKAADVVLAGPSSSICLVEHADQRIWI